MSFVGTRTRVEAVWCLLLALTLSVLSAPAIAQDQAPAPDPEEDRQRRLAVLQHQYRALVEAGERESERLESLHHDRRQVAQEVGVRSRVQVQHELLQALTHRRVEAIAAITQTEVDLDLLEQRENEGDFRPTDTEHAQIEQMPVIIGIDREIRAIQTRMHLGEITEPAADRAVQSLQQQRERIYDEQSRSLFRVAMEQARTRLDALHVESEFLETEIEEAQRDLEELARFEFEVNTQLEEINRDIASGDRRLEGLRDRMMEIHIQMSLVD